MPNEMLLKVEGLTKKFRVGKRELMAVRNASFELPAGKTLGLVGESGSGKSTLGRSILSLTKPNSGIVRFDGVDLGKLSPKQLRAKRNDMQMIFQDPLASLNQRATVGWAIEDALRIHKQGTPKERKIRTEYLLERVGLSAKMYNVYPFELSGGQQQRVGIARALALNPKLIVCDEAVSALDVSVQLQIIRLLQELQREMNLAYIFISHNLAVVEYLSDYVAVMYLGEIVEQGTIEDVFQNPQHPYTRVLMKSVLMVPEPGQRRGVAPMLTGEIPSPLNPPSGCPFHPRCPLAQSICAEQKPMPTQVSEGHYAACHFAERTAE